MGIFDKVFGSKDTTAKTASKGTVEGVGFITALSMHLGGELDEALQAYLSIANDFPEDSVAPFLAATIKAGKGDVAKAVDDLRSLSRNIASRGDTISHAIAVELAERATSRTVPATAEVIVSFAEQIKEKGNVQEAAVCLEIAAALVPDNANVLHKFGDTLHDLRMYEYAESVLLEALEKAPNHWGAIYTYAVLLQDLGRDAEAIPYYEKAVTFHPTHARCQNNYAAALLRTKRPEEALAHCETAARLDPASPHVRLNLGNIHLAMQQYEKARTCFTEAISLDGNIAPAYLGLGRVEEVSGGDAAKAEELYRKALQLDPSLAGLHPSLRKFAQG